MGEESPMNSPIGIGEERYGPAGAKREGRRWLGHQEGGERWVRREKDNVPNVLTSIKKIFIFVNTNTRFYKPFHFRVCLVEPLGPSPFTCKGAAS